MFKIIKLITIKNNHQQRRGVQKLHNTINAISAKLFTDVFSISLKLLKFYGAYQPEVTKSSIFRGIFMLSFIVLQFLTASIYRVFLVKDFNDFIIAAVYVIFSVNLTVKLTIFMQNQGEIVDLMDAIMQLDHDIDKKVVFKENKSIVKLILMLLTSDISTGMCLTISILIFSSQNVFTIPLLYYPESEIGYYTMFIIHFIQIVGIGTLAHSVEMIPIIVLMKLNYGVRHMCENMSKTNNGIIDMIKKIVEKHIEIERILDKLEFYHGPSFLIQSSLISIFLCILSFKMITASINHNYNDLIYSFGFFFIMLTKIALPCYFGQQLINESEELFNSVYNLPWYEMDMKSRRCIMIMMEKCQNEITMRIQGFFEFDFIHLGGIIQLAYSYYSVLQSLTD